MVSQGPNWSDTAAIYKKFESFTGQYARYAVKILLPHVLGKVEDHHGDIKIADIACGTGAGLFSIVEELRDTHASVLPSSKVTLLASDLSEGMLAKVTEHWSRLAPESKPPNVVIQNLPPSDMANLESIPTASLDGILCTFGLMFSLNPAKALAEFRRVLKPGAIAVIVTWTEDLSSIFIAFEARRRLIESKVGSSDVGNADFAKPGGPLSLATNELMLQAIAAGFGVSVDDAKALATFEQQTFTGSLTMPQLVASMRLNPVAAGASPIQPPWTFPNPGAAENAASDQSHSDKILTKLVTEIIEETDWLNAAKQQICGNDAAGEYLVPLFGHAVITSIRLTPSA